METLIDWKPSQLPVDTVIYLPNDRDYAGYWIKEEGGSWARIRTWQDDVVDANVVNLLFKDFEITAVPASWYEEFKLVSPETKSTLRINRAGWVLRGGIKSHDGKNEQLRIADNMFISGIEAVRKAFA